MSVLRAGSGSNMKCVLVITLALCVLACALPRPAEKDSEEVDKAGDAEEVYVVPLERSRPRRPFFGFGISDDLAPPPPFLQNNPFFRGGPFGGARPALDDSETEDFMTQMQEMLTEMRRQLTDLLHHAHSGDHLPGDNGTGVGTRIGDGDDELPQNKTTSTTKVIDGHVVTVNETTYSSGDDNIGAVFRIKVVEVKPSETPEADGEGEIEGEITPETDNEPSKPKSPKPEQEPTTSKNELDEDKHEETNEIPNFKVNYEWSSEFDPSLNEINQSGEFSAERFTKAHKENYYDLSSDTKVNDYLRDQQQSQELIMIEPEAELIDSDSYYRYDRIPHRLESIHQ